MASIPEFIHHVIESKIPNLYQILQMCTGYIKLTKDEYSTILKKLGPDECISTFTVGGNDSFSYLEKLLKSLGLFTKFIKILNITMQKTGMECYKNSTKYHDLPIPEAERKNDLLSAILLDDLETPLDFSKKLPLITISDDSQNEKNKQCPQFGSQIKVTNTIFSEKYLLILMQRLSGEYRNVNNCLTLNNDSKYYCLSGVVINIPIKKTFSHYMYMYIYVNNGKIYFRLFNDDNVSEFSLSNLHDSISTQMNGRIVDITYYQLISRYGNIYLYLNRDSQEQVLFKALQAIEQPQRAEEVDQQSKQSGQSGQSEQSKLRAQKAELRARQSLQAEEPPPQKQEPPPQKQEQPPQKQEQQKQEQPQQKQEQLHKIDNNLYIPDYNHFGEYLSISQIKKILLDTDIDIIQEVANKHYKNNKELPLPTKVSDVLYLYMLELYMNNTPGHDVIKVISDDYKFKVDKPLRDKQAEENQQAAEEISRRLEAEPLAERETLNQGQPRYSTSTGHLEVEVLDRTQAHNPALSGQLWETLQAQQLRRIQEQNEAKDIAKAIQESQSVEQKYLKYKHKYLRLKSEINK